LTRTACCCFCLLLMLIRPAVGADADADADDLNPVTFLAAPSHKPIVLVRNGQAMAGIWRQSGGDPVEIQRTIREATGVSLPILEGEIRTPAIVIGDCDLARQHGLDGSKMPPEGFAIKTAPGFVFIVGNGDGTKWGCYEFLERFVGLRWYFPPAAEGGEDIGRDVPRTAELSIDAVWLEDAPVFPMRVIWPDVSMPWSGKGINLKPLHQFLRSGSSWPVRVQVHKPDWSSDEYLRRTRPEVFQLRKDGSRQFDVLCYGNPMTLQTYLEGIQNHIDGKTPRYAPVSASGAITVSPADVELACYCADCRALWDDDGGQYGAASRVMAAFVDHLARAVLDRWPERQFTIIYLPYLNYTAAPDGIHFPGNVEVQLCGMPGLAMYKEQVVRVAEQANIDKWIDATGRRIQNWHYSAWPAHKTAAAYQYVHVIRDFYQANRDKTVGTFINGEFNHWPRQHISLYCWMKLLWNPDFNVDAAMNEFTRRMFGPAAATMRELLAAQLDDWEQSQWSGGRLSPRGVYGVSFTPDRVERIKALLTKARQQADKDPLTLARLDYYASGMQAFFDEAALMAGEGFRPLAAQKTGENPNVDGVLDEPAWQFATATPFVTATGDNRGKPPKYPTTVQALWTTDGITFGLTMTEPTPDRLETVNGGRDDGQMWWDDNIEIFIDVTARNEGEFYQLLINARGQYLDSRRKDATWNCPGFKAACFRGATFWSMEVFIPYAAFPEANIPRSGTPAVWTGNLTRHRVCDRGLKPAAAPIPGSSREYTRMNTTGAPNSDNLADFGEIRFVE